MPQQTSTDPAFEGAGQKPGIEIWRIEKLHPVLQPKADAGKFFSGDSYLVLVSKRKGRDALEWDLHFWLGADSSQDERGVAAYKTVELDDYLGGAPVQYREVQNHESKNFLSHFKGEISYMSGGIESGFKKVDRDAYDKKLFHVKGSRNVRVQQVALSCESLNHGDVFVLDDGKKVYCWMGKKSTKKERIKATEIARKIKDEERGGKAKVIIIDSGVDSEKQFFTALGDDGPIKSAEEGGDDADFEKKSKANIKLYRVSDASGEITIEESAVPPLKQDHLDPDDCFILDGGPSGVFSWIGKQCTPQEKKAAMANAMKFIGDKGYPDYTQVTRVVQNAETPMFKSFFKNWVDEGAQVGFGKVEKTNALASYDTTEFDITKLHNKEARKQEKMPDDGSGTVKIWRIENFKKKDLPEDQYGVFYDGDCFIVFYTYKIRNREAYLIYFWQGTKSTADEKGASALISQKIDEEYGGEPVQVRVVQNKEPEHFLQIFKGKMIVKKGGFASAFVAVKKTTDVESRVKEGVHLFHIRGTSSLNTRAIEVIARGSSLNSNDVFILKSPTKSFVWNGNGASEEEKEFAVIIAKHVSPGDVGSLVKLPEGEEGDEFWTTLGGKEEYASAPRLAEAETDAEQAHLYQCSNASGKFMAEEVYDFDQEDLVEDDVFFLDTQVELFVWVGQGANFIEKKEGLNMAVKYIEADPKRTVESTSIMQVKQGYEPPTFTGHFFTWDYDKWSSGKTYEEIKAEMGDSAGVSSVADELAKYSKTYTYEELVKFGNTMDGIDTTNKEKHLNDADFEKVFKMSKEAYERLPKWKKENAKRAAKLF